jgi:hypothetical protein
MERLADVGIEEEEEEEEGNHLRKVQRRGTI